jgi:uncharacterized protein YndB with AHSA1/START domain
MTLDDRQHPGLRNAAIEAQAMTGRGARRRTDSASRIIMASPQAIYRAFIDPQAMVSWLPPAGMKGRILAFDPREGGTYSLALTYDDPYHPVPGKTSQHCDIVRGRFVELVADRRIVQLVEFESEDPAFAGTMTLTWALAAVAGGTEVTIRCDGVPEAIRQEDHEAGLGSTLANLAAFTE